MVLKLNEQQKKKTENKRLYGEGSKWWKKQISEARKEHDKP